MAEPAPGGDSGFTLRWGRPGRDGTGARSLVIAPGRTPPVRLNSDLGARYRPERLAEIPDNAAKLDRLKDDLLRTLDIFAKHPRQFVEVYFRFIAERIEAETATLDRALAWSGGLFTAGDWIFSALRPLPQAVVVESGGQGGAVGPVCDFAFWTGRHVLAVELHGSARSRRDQAGKDGLPPDLVKPVTIAVAALAGGTDIFTTGDFPPEFLSFWEGEGVPSSPFRPVGLTQRPDPL